MHTTALSHFTIYTQSIIQICLEIPLVFLRSGIYIQQSGGWMSITRAKIRKNNSVRYYSSPTKKEYLKEMHLVIRLIMDN